MNYLVRRFHVRLQIIILLFEDLELILKIALENIDKEKLTDPYLTIPILENCIEIANHYRNMYKYLLEKEIHEVDLNTLAGWTSGFARSFENPLPYSEDWYQKIARILDGLTENFNEINNLLKKGEK